MQRTATGLRGGFVGSTPALPKTASNEPSPSILELPPDPSPVFLPHEVPAELRACIAHQHEWRLRNKLCCESDVIVEVGRRLQSRRDYLLEKGSLLAEELEVVKRKGELFYRVPLTKWWPEFVRGVLLDMNRSPKWLCEQVDNTQFIARVFPRRTADEDVRLKEIENREIVQRLFEIFAGSAEFPILLILWENASTGRSQKELRRQYGYVNGTYYLHKERFLKKAQGLSFQLLGA